MTLRRRTLTWALLAAVLLSGCGEQKFEHAGSPTSLVEDQQACAVEIAKSPAALAYRQNPAAHQDYPSQAFADIIHCAERKGWKQVGAEWGRIVTDAAKTRASKFIHVKFARTEKVDGAWSRRERGAIDCLNGWYYADPHKMPW